MLIGSTVILPVLHGPDPTSTVGAEIASRACPGAQRPPDLRHGLPRLECASRSTRNKLLYPETPARATSGVGSTDDS